MSLNNFLGLPKKLLGKRTNSSSNSQVKVTVCKHFLGIALKKLQFALALMAFFWTNFSGIYVVDCKSIKDSKSIDIHVSNDSVFNFELIRKVNVDTTLVLHFSKES